MSSAQAEARAARTGGYVLGAFLIKVAKHLALLASLVIVGSATGRATVDELGIFLLVSASAALYSIGRSLERRSSPVRFRVRDP